jgi:hypothetical protein
MGAPFTPFGPGQEGGSAFVYQRSAAGGRSAIAKLDPSDSTPFDSFGGYVAIDGSTILIGAESAPAPSSSQEGAAYILQNEKLDLMPWGFGTRENLPASARQDRTTLPQEGARVAWRCEPGYRRG